MATFDELTILRDRILVPIGESHQKIPEQKLSAFLAAKGRLYQGELMVVGRAVNGWEQRIDTSLLSTTDGIDSAIRNVFEANRKHECPMGWVSASWHAQKGCYNTAKSAFWRVIRRVVQETGVADVEASDWPSHIVWSNLYKIAPAVTGNPSGRLAKVQLPGCVEMLQAEVKEYKPKRLLFLTGMNWADPFLNALAISREFTPPGKQAQLGGRHTYADGWEAKVVVATHPQRKPENDWVREVVSVFQAVP